MVANFFGADGLSVGVFPYGGKRMDEMHDPGDNGTYVIKGWEIVDRLAGGVHYDGPEQHEYELTGMLVEIDGAQPTDQQLGADYITAEEVTADEIRVGDRVYIDIFGRKELVRIVAYGDDRIVNGRNVKGLPFFRYWHGLGCDYEDNCNNYLERTDWNGNEIRYRRARARRES